MAQLELKVVDGPQVVVVNPEVLLSETRTGAKTHARAQKEVFDHIGAAFWEAAERKEPLGSIVFASLVRRGLTEVPISWTKPDGSHHYSLLRRVPDLLGGKLDTASERACRALSTLVNPAKEASTNEEPLLDKAALTWRAWRHRERRLPSDEDWQQTKEYVDAVKHGAEVMQEPQSMRELAALHFQGHTEAKLVQNKTLAESYWTRAAREGDVWSAWHAALSYLRDDKVEEAAPYIDMVGNSSAAPLAFMALHFKFRLGIGQSKDPAQAGQFLKAAADFGNSNAQLILAHSYMGYTHGNMDGIYPPGGPDKALALVYYKVAAANGRLVPKLNAGLLIAQGADPAIPERNAQCAVAYRELAEVIHAAHPSAHLLFAHARRAFVLGDTLGARLRFALLSDAGFLMAHLNSAWLWDQDARRQASFWDRWTAPSQGTSPVALAYYIRAAAAGHVPSMTEVSMRLLKEADRANEPSSRQHLQHLQHLQAAAYRWTALAAERGDGRATFDQAYLLQFGIGTQRDEQLANKLYGKLLGGGSGWPARVAALSWLGLTAARGYFLKAWDGLRPLLGSWASLTLLQWWPGSAQVQGVTSPDSGRQVTRTSQGRKTCSAQASGGLEADCGVVGVLCQPDAL